MESLFERAPRVEVCEATPDDALEIRDVLYDTWMATYPNEEAGVTTNDIDELYKDRDSKERIQKSRERLANPLMGEHSLVAKVNGKIVGVSRVLCEKDRNTLKTLYVHPDFQGQGVGTALWQEAQKYFDPGKDTYLAVAEYNARAIGFYAGLGFEDTGQRFVDERFKMKSGAVIREMEMCLRAETPKEEEVIEG